MSKKNLQLELGGKYVTEMFHNALFTHDGKLCKLRHCGDNAVDVLTVDLENPTENWNEEVLPVDVLHGFSKFQWPTLGYRQLMTDHGYAVIHITAVRSALRGLRAEHLHYDWPAVSKRIRPLARAWEVTPMTISMTQVFNPKFVKFTEGLALLLAGQTAMFAVNPHLMVCVSVDQSADTAYDIYFRQKLVGTIDEAGNINLFNKIVQRSSVKAALFG